VICSECHVCAMAREFEWISEHGAAATVVVVVHSDNFSDFLRSLEWNFSLVLCS
jgi:hypothetical protein